MVAEQNPNGNTSADPLKGLRIDQNFADQTPTERLITVVPVKKPARHEFIRVRSGEEWRFRSFMYFDKTDGECYFVDTEMRDVFPDELKVVELVTAITRQGSTFLWPIPLADLDGKWNVWHRSAFEGAKVAERSWVRIVPDRLSGYYQIHVAKVEIPEPSWPPLSLEELLIKAVKDRRISSDDHPLIRKLLGAC